MSSTVGAHARRDDRRAVLLQDDCGTGDLCARREELALVEGGIETLQLVVDAENAGADLDLGVGERAPGRRPQLRQFRQPADAGHAHVDDLDWACLDRRARIPSGAHHESARHTSSRPVGVHAVARERHLQLVALTDVAQVADTHERDPLGVKPVGGKLRSQRGLPSPKNRHSACRYPRCRAPETACGWHRISDRWSEAPWRT